MTYKPVEYKLTDKWPEPWRSDGLVYESASDNYVIYSAVEGEHYHARLSRTFVASNPDKFEKVEEEKPCRCTVSHKWLNELEKKAKAGEELAKFLSIPNPWGITIPFIESALKKYREAVK